MLTSQKESYKFNGISPSAEMKFVNGKLLGRKRALTTLPGIGQIYALRLEAVGFKKVISAITGSDAQFRMMFMFGFAACGSSEQIQSTQR